MKRRMEDIRVEEIIRRGIANMKDIMENKYQHFLKYISVTMSSMKLHDNGQQFSYVPQANK